MMLTGKCSLGVLAGGLGWTFLPGSMRTPGSVSPMLPTDGVGLGGTSVSPHPTSGPTLHTWQGAPLAPWQPLWPKILC